MAESIEKYTHCTMKAQLNVFNDSIFITNLFFRNKKFNMIFIIVDHTYFDITEKKIFSKLVIPHKTKDIMNLFYLGSNISILFFDNALYFDYSYLDDKIIYL